MAPLPHAQPARVPLLQPLLRHVALPLSSPQMAIRDKVGSVSVVPTAWALCHGQGTPGMENHGGGICFNQMCSVIRTLLCFED